MLIFVHLPKTAGTSFVSVLNQHFGAGTHSDFLDYPMNTPRQERNAAALRNAVTIAEDGLPNVECIHGHFLAVKYLLLASKRPAQFVTWLRSPADRLRSNYYFWQRQYPVAPPQAAVHRRVVEEDWTLERFCFSEEFRDMYAQFLWGFPLAYFDFVGVTEFFDEDVQYFTKKFLGLDLQPARLNAAPSSDADAHGPMDAGFRAEVEAFHVRDMALYRRAIEMREERRARDLLR